MGEVRTPFDCTPSAINLKSGEGLMLTLSMKQSGEQYDDRIIEVAWDTDRDTWKLLRIRDDKPDGNHKSIVDKILVSIRDGVEIEAVSLSSDPNPKSNDARRQNKSLRQ